MRFLLIGHIVCPVELTRGKSNLGLGLSGSGNVLGPQEAWGGHNGYLSIYLWRLQCLDLSEMLPGSRNLVGY